MYSFHCNLFVCLFVCLLISGELNEAQKQKIEQNKLVVQKQKKELEDAYQRMAKLSEIVDKQSAEITKLKQDRR